MEIDRKQVGTVFIALIFVVSGISFALSWQPTTSQGNSNTDSDIIDNPLSNEMRTVFPQDDITVLTIFYSEESEESLAEKQTAEKINNQMGEKLLLEEIDVSRYQSFSAGYNVRNLPTIIIRGKNNINAPIRIEENLKIEVLKEKICSTFEEKPGACS